jgi:hypothetical protein
MFLRAFCCASRRWTEAADDRQKLAMTADCAWRDERGNRVDNAANTLEFAAMFVDKPLARTQHRPVWLVLPEGAANN